MKLIVLSGVWLKLAVNPIHTISDYIWYFLKPNLTWCGLPQTYSCTEILAHGNDVENHVVI